MRLTKLFLFFSLYLIVPSSFLFADGTRELEGSGGVTKIQVGKMAGYGATEALRLNIRIGHPNQEAVYMGFRLPNGSPTLYFRVIDPNGNMVYGPEQVPTGAGPGFINNMAEANLGPFVLTGGRGGYNPQYFVPSVAGDHFIEFSTDPFLATTFNIEFSFFDITVGRFNPSAPIPGRVWCRNWVLNAQSFGNPSYSKFFVYTPDSVVTQFNLNGMRPFGFEISCNKTGVTNTGNIANDRKSVQGNVSYSEYPIFLSNPDSILFPTGLGPVSISSPVNISGCPQTGYCIEVGLNKTANAEVYLELNGIAGYQPMSPDLKVDRVLNPGINCIPWDGKDAWGRIVPLGTTISVQVGIIAGLTNFPIFDPERNDNGIIVSVVRPSGPPPKVFWDDSNLPNGTVELDGCVGACRAFTPNFGNNRTINTWWYTGRVDRSFTYRIVANCPVKAKRDTASAWVNSSVSISVLANDNDPDRNIDTSTLVVITPPRNGSFSVANGVITYTPNHNFVCADSLRYRISDRGPTAYSAIPRYSDSAFVRVEVKVPSPRLGPDSNITICSLQPPFTLNAFNTLSGFELRWFKGSLNNRIQGTPIIQTDSAGLQTYYVTQSLIGAVCQSRPKVVKVNILPTPNSSFSGLNEEICQSAKPINLLPLTPNGIFTGNKVQGNTFLPDSIGSYSITYTVSNGNCTNSSNVNFRVILGVDAAFTGLDTAYCVSGGAITLNPANLNGSFYLNGVQLSSNQILLNQPGQFTVKHLVRNANGCTDSLEKIFKVGSIIPITIGTLPSQICKGSSPINLVGSPLGGKWIGRFVNGNTFTPSDTGNISIGYVFNNNGCVDTAFATIRVLATPIALFTGLANTYCLSSDTIQLVPVQFGGVFSGSAVTLSGKWVPNTLGPQTITYSIGLGPCIENFSLNTEVFAYPNSKFTGLDTGYCLSSSPVVLLPVVAGGRFSGTGINGNLFIPNQEGQHKIFYQIELNGCVSIDSQWVRVSLPTNLSLTPNDTQFCQGDSPILLVPNPTGGIFSGPFIDSISQTFRPYATGTYTLTYTFRNGGCLNKVERRFVVNALPTPSVGDSVSILRGQTVQLSAIGGTRYEWKPAIGLSDSTAQNPMANPKFSTKYTVKVFNPQGCSVIKEQVVNVIQPIKSPSVFTPNGDKLNDVWVIPYLEQWPNASVSLYDRWGVEVFNQAPYHNNFDFRDKANEVLPAGTYFYSISLNNGTEPITGYLELIY